MKRLTEKVFGFVQLKACGNDFCKETCAEHDEEKSCKNCHIQKAFEKLAEYEDLDEQGLLLRLPCKVGDIIYEVNPLTGKITERKINSIVVCNCPDLTIMYKSGYDYSNVHDDFGKTVLLTQEEAEQKLKEMEGRHGITE